MFICYSQASGVLSDDSVKPLCCTHGPALVIIIPRSLPVMRRLSPRSQDQCFSDAVFGLFCRPTLRGAVFVFSTVCCRATLPASAPQLPDRGSSGPDLRGSKRAVQPFIAPWQGLRPATCCVERAAGNVSLGVCVPSHFWL